MSKLHNDGFRHGENRNRYETFYSHMYRVHDNKGDVLREYTHHHKNTRHHHRK